jgi:subtilisin family serine protease
LIAFFITTLPVQVFAQEAGVILESVAKGLVSRQPEIITKKPDVSDAAMPDVGIFAQGSQIISESVGKPLTFHQAEITSERSDVLDAAPDTDSPEFEGSALEMSDVDPRTVEARQTDTSSVNAPDVGTPKIQVSEIERPTETLPVPKPPLEMIPDWPDDGTGLQAVSEAQYKASYTSDRFIVRYRESPEPALSKSIRIEESTLQGIGITIPRPIEETTVSETDGHLTPVRILQEERIQTLQKNLKIEITSAKRIQDAGADVIITKEKITAEDLRQRFSLRENPEILSIQPDYEVTLSSADPLLSEQWGLYQEHSAPDFSDPAGVRQNIYRMDAHVQDAWDKSEGQGILVAVLDTAVDRNHEDLSANIHNVSDAQSNAAPVIRTFPEIQHSVTASVYTSGVSEYVYRHPAQKEIIPEEIVPEKILPEDIFPREWTADPDAGEWHGTHVAGIIAGLRDNGAGIAGVAPQANLLPIAVFTVLKRWT